MSKEGQPQEFWELSIEEQFNQSEEQFKAVEEANIEFHLAKNGEAPNYGIPIIDALKNIGCPCWQCLRDEFL